MSPTMTWAGPVESATALTDGELRRWKALPAQQQPDWDDKWLVDEVGEDLAGMPGLVGWDEVRALRQLLAEAASGQRRIVQAGDCAEDPAECEPGRLSSKVRLLDAMAEVMRITAGTPVIRVGRIAGQFAKPRSSATELVDGVALQVFRGHLVNGPEAAAHLRRADPLRLLSGYEAARTAMAFLHDDAAVLEARVWTSHEALVLDYELPLLRRGPDDRLILTSTHWPWVGERTRQPDGAHVRLLAAVSNPVACKVGPSTTEEELRTLCRVLDPQRSPGRLTLIARMGADLIAERLPRLVAAVRSAGHPVIWLCDPMHGNTVRTRSGRKTRLLSSIIREVREFQAIVDGTSGTAGGLHLETTPDLVAECAFGGPEAGSDIPEGPYRTLCDPRLNPEQSLVVTEKWYR